jgi:predicted PurR-regulated permease PerM
VTFDAVNRLAVLATTALLAAGLGVWLARGPGAAEPLLDAGLIALMLTPVLRLITTLVDDIRRRDAVAVATTVAVCVILGVGLVLALRQ